MDKKLKMKKYFKRTLLVLGVFIAVILIALTIYASGSYKPLSQMQDNIDDLDLSGVEVYRDFDEIRYTVDNPIKHILFIPGGLVEPESYEYLMANLAIQGYNVTLFKAFFNLAIFTPNYANKFLSDDLDNVVIGHSLGGVVGSMLANDNEKVSSVVLMGSYPIKDLSDKAVLLITAEYDDGLDEDKFNESLQYVNEDAEHYHIDEGNHAQFGWYGPQKGDGEATISTLEQQTIVINEILDYIQN